MQLTNRLVEAKKISPPGWLPASICYETVMGSQAYGVSTDSSDVDVYGFCIPPKELVFPHLAGEIPGFGRQLKRFSQYQEHHIESPDKRKSYDLQIFSIVRYFDLAMENNPNVIDSLFTPAAAVLYSNPIAEQVRARRKDFLHKGAWHKFKGYAYSQLHKMDNKNPEGKRLATVEQYGYDVKFAYHLVRLLDEVEQILAEGDIDLQRNREQLKSIRRGEWTQQEIRDWFYDKERSLEKLYHDSRLRHGPDEALLKSLLLDCLEQHYGSLAEVPRPERYLSALREIREVLDRAGLR